MKRAALLLALGLAPGVAGAGMPILAISDDEAALTRALNEKLLANPSATAVLQAWCDEHGVGEKVRAEVDRAAAMNPSAATHARLGPENGQAIAYRRVRLSCGPFLLSEADNWYVPARLTPEMNAALAGDTPFGTAIKPLKPSRKTLSTEFEWAGQESHEILRHRALVSAGDGAPLAEVVETYQRTMLKPSH